MRDVLATNKGYSESDLQAYREAEKEQKPNRVLLKSRLLFDGGYYTQSKALILGLFPAFETLSSDEKIEFYYRLGRIEHALENKANALLYYQSAISSGQNSPLYYAASAALRCAEIHENESQIPEAVKMYNLCLDLKPEEYRKGLHFKAKAGLNRISVK
jgi:tetratricopeptide (TPR) repeat protein